MSTIGAKIDNLHQLRELKREAEEQVKEIAKRMDDAELELIKQMDAEGVSKSTGRSATVAISESVKPSVEDWELFYTYIGKNKYYHLLERRPSVLACRELLETKGKIPGVVPFTQRKLRMNSIE